MKSAIISPINSSIVSSIIGGGGSSVPGEIPTVVDQTNLVMHLHATASEGSSSGGRLTVGTNLSGGSDATGGVSDGALLEVDGLGRKVWRFLGEEYLSLPTDITFDARNTTCFFIGRAHKRGTQGARNRIFSIGQAGLANTGAALVEVYKGPDNAWPYISGAGRDGYDRPNSEEMLAGHQLQMLGTSMSASKSLLMVNDKTADDSAPSNIIGVLGGEIGRYAHNPGSSGSWGYFDLYEIVIYNVAKSDIEAADIADDLLSNWAVPELTNDLLIDGDSILDGVVDVNSAEAISSRLTEPGGDAYIPNTWRVLNAAASGAHTADLVTRRDVASSPVKLPHLSGRRVFHYQSGRNDWNDSNDANYGGTTVLTEARADNITSQQASLLNTATDGYLQNGYECQSGINIASSAVFEDSIGWSRGNLISNQFLIDTDSDSGGTYDGEVTSSRMDLIEVASNTIFDTVADANDLTYYQNDQTHPNATGTFEMAKQLKSDLDV